MCYKSKVKGLRAQVPGANDLPFFMFRCAKIFGEVAQGLSTDIPPAPNGGNWLGLWTPANGYRSGEELACNKQGLEVGHFQLFAIPRARFHADYIKARGEADAQHPIDLTPVRAIPTQESSTASAIYDLSGRRVAASILQGQHGGRPAKKGVYITAGKKVVR